MNWEVVSGNCIVALLCANHKSDPCHPTTTFFTKNKNEKKSSSGSDWKKKKDMNLYVLQKALNRTAALSLPNCSWQYWSTCTVNISSVWRRCTCLVRGRTRTCVEQHSGLVQFNSHSRRNPDVVFTFILRRKKKES
jgi:hypothetical protein